MPIAKNQTKPRHSLKQTVRWIYQAPKLKERLKMLLPSTSTNNGERIEENKEVLLSALDDQLLIILGEHQTFNLTPAASYSWPLCAAIDLPRLLTRRWV